MSVRPLRIDGRKVKAGNKPRTPHPTFTMYKILLYALIILIFAWAALIATVDVVIKAI